MLNTALATTDGALQGVARDDMLLGTNSRSQRRLKWSLLTIHLIAMFYQIKFIFPLSCMATHKMMAAVVLSCLKKRYFSTVTTSPCGDILRISLTQHGPSYPLRCLEKRANAARQAGGKIHLTFMGGGVSAKGEQLWKKTFLKRKNDIGWMDTFCVFSWRFMKYK